MLMPACKKLVLAITVVIVVTACDAGDIAHRAKRKLKSLIQSFSENVTTTVDTPMVNGVSVNLNIAYGLHPNQQIDIYAPIGAKQQPIIMHLHGGGWAGGSKSERASYINKVNRWVAKGFMVITVETRLMPDADVYDQVCDLAEAIVFVQQQAKEWGGDGSQLILSGHSSAGTMVSVLAAKPSIVTDLGGKPWLGSIAIDSSSLDIPRTMRLWSPEMFSYAYGEDPKKWVMASPINLLSEQSLPMLFTCSIQRPDSSCEQATLFVEKASQFGVKTAIIKHDFDHGAMDFELGLNKEYTQEVEQFMAGLDVAIAEQLQASNLQSLPEGSSKLNSSVNPNRDAIK